MTTPTKGDEIMERIRTGLRIPYEMNTELILIAKEYGISKNALMLEILRNWVKENDKKEG